MNEVTISGLEQVVDKLQKIKTTDYLDKAFNRAGLRVERDAKINAPRSTGHLAREITYKVETEEDTITTTIGTGPMSPPYNVYMEYGTGLFAVNGNGRTTDLPWHYKDDDDNWYSTSGNKPQPYMVPALTTNRQAILDDITSAIKEALK